MVSIIHRRMRSGTGSPKFTNAFWGAHTVCGIHGSRTKSTKNPPTFIRRRKVPWRFFVRKIALPHIDLVRSRHLAVSNDRLPDSVSESLLMLDTGICELRPFVKFTEQEVTRRVKSRTSHKKVARFMRLRHKNPYPSDRLGPEERPSDQAQRIASKFAQTTRAGRRFERAAWVIRASTEGAF